MLSFLLCFGFPSVLLPSGVLTTMLQAITLQDMQLRAIPDRRKRTVSPKWGWKAIAVKQNKSQAAERNVRTSYEPRTRGWPVAPSGGPSDGSPSSSFDAFNRSQKRPEGLDFARCLMSCNS